MYIQTHDQKKKETRNKKVGCKHYRNIYKPLGEATNTCSEKQYEVETEEVKGGRNHARSTRSREGRT